MHLYMAPSASGVRQTAVEVKIWEQYLLRSRTHMPNTLCAYSLDNGPWHETDDGRFIFRFTAFDWFNKISQLLSRENIHCDLIRHFTMEPHAHCTGKISLVTTDSDLSDSLIAGLETAGYQVRFFSSDPELLENTFSHTDLVIIDRHIHGIDALKICRQVRTHPSTKDVPVILLSANGTKSKEALLAGATDLIEKPFHIHYLLNVVARYTHREQ